MTGNGTSSTELPETAADALEVASTVARGVGAAVLGPLVAATLDSAEARRAVRGYIIEAAIGIGLGVAAGIWLGSLFKRRA